jgi:tetratricopeptide (TPR) repeat protein
LLGGGDDDETQAPPGDGGHQEHDVSVSIGPASSSVLAEIGERLGGIPASLLRDSDDHGRSNSSDEPDSDAPGSDGPHSDERRSDGRSKRERYQIFGEIDRGGMGAILRGRDTDLGRELAFKVLLESHKGKPDLIKRFVEEAQIGGQLQHPGVVPVYDLGTFTDQRPYFTMKLVKGRTLAALLGERGPVSAPSSPTTPGADATGLATDDPHSERGRVSAPSSPSQSLGAHATGLASDLPRLLSIFEQVCQTLAYAHSRRVIHRDLKPANIMVGSFGEVQVMDWGLAKVLGASGEETEPRERTEPAASVIRTARSTTETQATGIGSVLGTFAYMPPEQAIGDIDEVDERADVFGLGSILCEILTGKPPYTGPSSDVILRRAKRGDTAEALDRLANCGADDELVTLARRCLAAERDERPRDAGEVAAETTAYLAGVQERLRKAELDRVEAQARADEETKRRTLADELAREAEARAQEEAKGRELADNLAREAQARAVEERKRRRVTVGLAASVLALAGLAGGTWLVGERSRVKQREAVAQALNEAKRLHELARAAETDDPARWTDALAALERAEGLLAQGGDPVQQLTADDLKKSLTTDRTAVQKEAEWLRRLVDLRATKVESVNALSADTGYAAVFRDAGIDPDALAPEAAAAKIRSAKPSLQQGLVTALDDWGALRRTERNALEGARRLLAVVRLADPDPWRERLRAAIDQPGGKDRLKALQALAASAPIDDLPAVSLDLLGVSLFDEGDANAAADLLRKAQRSRPADGWLKYNLARVLHKLGKKEEAIRYFMAARTIHPETAHDLAHLLGNSGETDEAIAIFRDLARLRPTDGRHFMCLGWTLKNQGRMKEAFVALDAAIDRYRERISRNSQDSDAHLRVGHCLRDKGDLSGAVAEYKTAIRLNPEAADIHWILGSALEAQGNFDEAIAECRIATRLKPDDADAHGHLGDALLATGKLDEAIAEYKTTIRLKPDYADGPYALGEALRQQGKLDDAIAEYKTAIRLKPDYAEVHNRLGNALRKKGKLDEANTEYNTAIRLNPDDAVFHSNLGLALRDLGKPDEAIVEFNTAIRLKPDYASAHFGLAYALQGQGKLNEAIVEFNNAIRLKPEYAAPHQNLGNALHDQGKFDEAVAAFRQAIKLEPNLAVAHSGLGRALSSQGKHQDSVFEFREAIRLDPDNFWGHAGLGLYLYEVAGDYRGAEAEFRAWIRLQPNFAGAYVDLGHALKSQRRLDDAVAAYRKAIRLDPNLAEAHDGLGTALGDQGKLDDAIAEYKAAIRLKPEHALLHIHLGIALRKHGKLNEAIAEYRSAIRIQPQSGDAYLGLGSALRDQKKPQQAIVAYRKAIEFGPSLAQAHYGLSKALCDQGKPEQAIPELRKAIESKPDYVEAYASLGDVLREQGKLDQAIEQYRKAIRIKPDYAEAHHFLGHALRDQGNPEGAITELRKAIESNRDYVEAYTCLGNALRDQGRLEDAIEQYRAAIKLKPEHWFAHAGLGATLRNQGNLDEAIRERRIVVRLKPGDADAHNNLGNALDDRGSLDEAIAEYRKAIDLNPDEYLPHNSLGHALRQLGDYTRSLAEIRKAHELGSKRPGWKYPSAAWVAEAEHMAALAPRLPAVLKSDDIPRDTAERLTFARMAYDGGHFAVAARLWSEATEADPKLAADREARHRYNAACAAALASAGKGKDDPHADAPKQAKLRRQALDSLRSELAEWARVANAEPAKASTTIVKTLRHWKVDIDLVSIRDSSALAKLTPDEQKAWSTLWADVDAMIKRNVPEPQAAVVTPPKAQSNRDEPATKKSVDARRTGPREPAPDGKNSHVAQLGGSSIEVEPARHRSDVPHLSAADVTQTGTNSPVKQVVQTTSAMANRWPAILKGTDRPRDNAERLAFAQLAVDQQHFAAAARFWADAFASDPKLAAGRDPERLYHAARAAILAAEGKGKDAPSADDQAKARLRAQAVHWLNAGLAVWNEVAGSAPAQDRMGLIRAQLQWKTDPDFAPMREPEALKKLPAEEQRAWRMFWARLDTTLHPDDCWAHTELGEALSAEGRREEAAAEFRKAVKLAPEKTATGLGMAMSMRAQGYLDPAIELFRRTAAWDDEHLDVTGGAVWELGHTLRAAGRYEEAVATYRRIKGLRRAKPEDLRAADSEIALTEAYRRSHAARAAALTGCERGADNPPPDDATKSKLRAQARDWFATELANLTKAQGADSGENRAGPTRILEFWRSTPDLAAVRDDEALKKLPLDERNGWRMLWTRIEVFVHPDDSWAHTRLGEALNAEGKRPEAAAEFRKATQLAPYHGPNCYSLGIAIREQGHPDLAIELQRRALSWDIEHLDNPGLAIWELAQTLRTEGRFDEAVATYRRIRELDRSSPYDLRRTDWEITATEAERSQMARLSEVLKGQLVVDQAQAAGLAELASRRLRYAAAAHLWSLGLAAPAKTADNRNDHCRYDAARCAVLAGCGNGRDDPPPDDAAKAKLRSQALEWLTAELRSWSHALDRRPAGQRKAVPRVLKHWKTEPELAGVRDADALAKLPNSEQQAWRTLWSDVDALLRKAQSGVGSK